MSLKLKRLSGKEVISSLNKFGLTFHSQKGSHVKLRRINPATEKETLTIPIHDELDVGTLRAIDSKTSCALYSRRTIKTLFLQ